jgi:hypothetical protein
MNGVMTRGRSSDIKDGLNIHDLYLWTERSDQGYLFFESRILNYCEQP